MIFFTPWWIVNNINNPHISTINIIKTYPIDLANSQNKERVIILEDTNYPSEQFAEVQKWNPHTNLWEVQYRKSFDKSGDIKVQNKMWNILNKKVLVLSNNVGSGAFLNYVILSSDDNKIQPVFEKSDVFQGDIWFEDSTLIQSTGNRYFTWRLTNGKLDQIPYALPIVPGAKVIEYSISPQGIVNVKKDNYVVDTGATIQLVRKDKNDVPERILFMDSTQNMEFIYHRMAFKIKEPGTFTVDIIPFGYDWDKMKEIKITAK